MEEKRVCRKCCKEYPLTSEFFKTTKLMPDGFYKTCKKCIAQYTPEYGRMKQLERRHKMTPEQYDSQLEEQGGRCALCPAKQGDDKRRMAVDHSHACCPTEIACGQCNRGILCANCNRRVGFLEEMLEDVLTMGTIVPKKGTWLDRALRYLNKYAPVTTHKDSTQETQQCSVSVTTTSTQQVLYQPQTCLD